MEVHTVSVSSRMELKAYGCYDCSFRYGLWLTEGIDASEIREM
jgi:hypothetical protein